MSQDEIRELAFPTATIHNRSVMKGVEYMCLVPSYCEIVTPSGEGQADFSVCVCLCLIFAQSHKK